MGDALVIALHRPAIAMRFLAGQTRKYGVPQLDPAGEALARYISVWIGEAATEPAVAEGVARLAHIISFFRDRPDRPQELIGAGLTELGLMPPGGIPSVTRLDQWTTLLSFYAQHLPADYSIVTGSQQ